MIERRAQTVFQVACLGSLKESSCELVCGCDLGRVAEQTSHEFYGRVYFGLNDHLLSLKDLHLLGCTLKSCCSYYVRLLHEGDARRLTQDFRLGV